ncbi:cell division protein FtsZ, partial [Pantoea agglomerans]|nr:cell division protein FtsZ [Pantoea agglomerans]
NDVNLIFGTSINENLGDEVVVTVIATGIDEDNNKRRPAASNSTQKITTPSSTTTEQNNDPFVDWDMRREPSAREQAQASEKFEEIEKKDF